MIRFMGCMASFFAVVVLCAGCATQQPTAQQENNIQQSKDIAQSIQKVNKEDMHGTSSESLSGKDYSHGR